MRRLVVASFPWDWALTTVLALALANIVVVTIPQPDAARYVMLLRLVVVGAAIGLVVLWRVRYLERRRAGPRTFKEEIAELVQRIRALVAKVKSYSSIDEGVTALTTPQAMAIIEHAHEVKLRLRSVLHSYAAAKELTALETWPCDALEHMADTFERLSAEVEPTLLASLPKPNRPR
jgi:4-amino-4-deoxy-L-arabinose transferase-like glycosyltransferase